MNTIKKYMEVYGGTWGKTAFHAGDTGSNPVGDAKVINHLADRLKWYGIPGAFWGAF